MKSPYPKLEREEGGHVGRQSPQGLTTNSGWEKDEGGGDTSRGGCVSRTECGGGGYDVFYKKD